MKFMPRIKRHTHNNGVECCIFVINDLILQFNGWVCLSDIKNEEIVGLGGTPKEAYENWLHKIKRRGYAA